MQTTHNPIGLHWPVVEQPVNARLSWLLDANADERARLLRERVDEQIMLMRKPVSIEKAYALFGLLLGTLPPAAIFYRLFGDVMMRENNSGWVLLILAMNVACSLAGWLFASKLSATADTIESDTWAKLFLLSPLLGMLWGTCAGAVGGLIFFVVGAFFGAFCAMVVGLIAFSLFMPLHRWLAHGGMIEASHLWPLACGVTMVITALILGL